MPDSKYTSIYHLFYLVPLQTDLKSSSAYVSVILSNLVLILSQVFMCYDCFFISNQILTQFHYKQFLNGIFDILKFYFLV